MTAPHRKQYRELRLILGDQLNRAHSWFKEKNDEVLYLIVELKQEAEYVKHHVQKICGFFAAMAEFADELQNNGHHVLHLDLDHSDNSESLPVLISKLCKKYKISCFCYQRPDEFRLREQLAGLSLPKSIQLKEVDTEHFLVPFSDLPSYFKAGKATRMESFYRKMRRHLDVLMDGDEPEGGKWNFDGHNRNRLDKAGLEGIPEPCLFENKVDAILQRLDSNRIRTFGSRGSSLTLPINRRQSLKLLRHFCNSCLPGFGRYQDAMTSQGKHRWSLYHSRLSFALNSKILHPMEVIEAALTAYKDNAAIDLAQTEGFVRQILGWREFIRGVYWANMPDYAGMNSLNARRDLPEFFWTGKTRMHCMQQAITQSLEYSYAHHIQRLMITGNFCLISGIKPDQVDAWYLGIYYDAIEWVELPNTRGMALHADGGLIGSKPYAASGNYINKMSDYCKDCSYKVTEKSGADSCPFNSLYWQFMDKHRDKFSNNPRMGMLYGSWDRMNESTRKSVLQTAQKHLKNLKAL